jgi:hypothetical protein
MEIAIAMSDERTVLLFSYGTLQRDEVQLSSFGRLLDGEDDAMVGYRQGRSKSPIQRSSA